MKKEIKEKWEKEIGEQKIATFGEKERLKDFPDLMEKFRQIVSQEKAKSYQEGFIAGADETAVQADEIHPEKNLELARKCGYKK